MKKIIGYILLLILFALLLFILYFSHVYSGMSSAPYDETLRQEYALNHMLIVSGVSIGTLVILISLVYLVSRSLLKSKKLGSITRNSFIVVTILSLSTQLYVYHSYINGTLLEDLDTTDFEKAVLTNYDKTEQQTLNLEELKAHLNGYKRHHWWLIKQSFYPYIFIHRKPNTIDNIKYNSRFYKYKERLYFNKKP